jgi:rhodanese-related sulfurtransferase
MKRILLTAAAALAFSIGSTHAAGTCDGHGKATKGEKSCCPSKTTEKNETPTMSELKTITRDELVSLIEAGNVTVFDARTEDQFAAGHVDGAVLFANATLPENKETTLVFYCGGMKCPAASKAAKKALEAGFTNVLVFRGGYAEWSAQQNG